MHGHLHFSSYPDREGNFLFLLESLAADVRGVDAAVRGGHLGQGDGLFGMCRATALETGHKTPGPLFHRSCG